MGFSEITGFFSYAHSDDTFGFLTNLRNDLCDEYRVLTGDELELFFDRDSIEWGERWEKSIEESVDAAGVFLPVVSPCYLASSSCMKELSQYLAKVEKAGAGDLILPLMMIDPSATRGADDRILGKLEGFQYKDISSMRFMDRGSGEYSKAINALAQGILKAQRALESAALRDISAIGGVPSECQSPCDDDAGFVLDALDGLPTKADAMLGSLISLMDDTARVGEAFEKTTQKIEEKSPLPGEALVLMMELARELDPIVDDMGEHSEEFSTLIAEADPLFRAILSSGIVEGSAAAPLNESVRALVKNVVTARSGIVSLQTAARDTGRLSRVLYKPLKALERSAAVCISSFDVCISWGEFLPEAGEA